ncbi:unnamed protein product [Rhizophagus irregularis]|nr:unnamed protein product [Rhizophagus irregularis]
MILNRPEPNDWDPKWPQTYPWLLRREDEDFYVLYLINNHDEISYQTPPTMGLPPPLYTQTLPSTFTSSRYTSYKNLMAGLKFIESISYVIERQVIEEINKNIE